jgi:hypothetical protein
MTVNSKQGPGSREEATKFWSVLVVDMFNYLDPEEGRQVVEGFESPEAAIEYARRRMRGSLEEQRPSASSAADLRSRWYMFGEDCSAIGTGYWASSEVDTFVANPATPDEIDWVALEPAPWRRALLAAAASQDRG